MTSSTWMVIRRILFFLWIFLKSASCLEMLEIVGPQLVNMGEVVTLVCRYDLGMDAIYSIKWYKDQDEIYRYVPTDRPEFLTFKTKGVAVEEKLTMPSKLVVRMADSYGTGIYKCEVTIETPRFMTLDVKKNVTVIVPPMVQPSPGITGMAKYYSPGDLVDVTCHVREAKPSPHLTWHINHKEVPSDMILATNKSHNHTTGLDSVSSNLRFTVQESDLTAGHLHISCLASIADVWKAKVEDKAVGIMANATQQTHQLVLDKSAAAASASAASKTLGLSRAASTSLIATSHSSLLHVLLIVILIVVAFPHNFIHAAIL